MDVLNNLNVDLKLVLVNIIGFVILLVVAKKMVFDPIGKVVTERDSDISGQYDRLESAQREMEALKSDYETRLTAIEAEAREKIQTAIKEAQAARDQILADAKKKADQISSPPFCTTRNSIATVTLGGDGPNNLLSLILILNSSSKYTIVYPFS